MFEEIEKNEKDIPGSSAVKCFAKTKGSTRGLEGKMGGMVVSGSSCIFVIYIFISAYISHSDSKIE